MLSLILQQSEDILLVWFLTIQTLKTEPLVECSDSLNLLNVRSPIDWHPSTHCGFSPIKLPIQTKNRQRLLADYKRNRNLWRPHRDRPAPANLRHGTNQFRALGRRQQPCLPTRSNLSICGESFRPKFTCTQTIDPCLLKKLWFWASQWHRLVFWSKSYFIYIRVNANLNLLDKLIWLEQTIGTIKDNNTKTAQLS